jgi:hypothetical protein
MVFINRIEPISSAAKLARILPIESRIVYSLQDFSFLAYHHFGVCQDGKIPSLYHPILSPPSSSVCTSISENKE